MDANFVRDLGATAGLQMRDVEVCLCRERSVVGILVCLAAIGCGGSNGGSSDSEHDSCANPVFLSPASSECVAVCVPTADAGP